MLCVEGIMGHSGDIAGNWEWDSVLLLSNPSLDSSILHSRSTFQTENGVNFTVGQSWADLDSTSSPSDGQVPQSSSTVYKTTTTTTTTTSAGLETIRDPRLDCPNFLAGRVPCACTDNEDNDDEGGSRSNKRAKLTARCQVPGCGANLARLKGYHQRHRVCLRCANATTVVLHDISQRYCQQCGKFHILGDFDEGKRSCRRKLERHNNRRRRKAQECGEDSGTLAGDNDNASPSEGIQEAQKVSGEGKLALESQMQSEVEPTIATQTSTKLSPIEQSETEVAHGLVDVAVSKAECGGQEAGGQYDIPETQILLPVESDQVWESSLRSRSPSDGLQGGVDEDSLLALLMEDTPNGGDSLPLQSFGLVSPMPPRPPIKRNTYTSSCPTGRISFKLYDWNPGDFPRNLRQQILEWLSNMPVDLEGYIRSGCTILTLFVAMPQSMWDNLYGDWEGAVTRLVQSPENRNGFWDKGYFNAKIGNRTVHFDNGKAVSGGGGKEDCMPCMPALSSVEPLCIQAGVECVVTILGRNLLQANTRLLVSHGGKYLDAQILDASPKSKNEDSWQVIIPSLNRCQTGPVFIEVENEGRTSNTMVILIGQREFCNEVGNLEEETISSDAQDLLYDLGWMLREASCDTEAACNRLQLLHQYAASCGWTRVADYALAAATRAGVSHKLTDFQTLDWKDTWCEEIRFEHQAQQSLSRSVSELNPNHLIPSLAPIQIAGDKDMQILVQSSSDIHEGITLPLLPTRRMQGRCHPSWGKRTSHLLYIAVSLTVACVGLCMVLQYPTEVTQLSTSLRRCLWGQ